MDRPPRDPQSPRPPLVRYLSKCNAAPRGVARELVRAGRVRVNGHVCTEGARRIDPRRDRVEVDGEPVGLPRASQRVWLVLNKPRGITVTTSDPRGRPTVMDLLQGPAVRGLAPVGRLDKASAGLLLLTNDGEAAARLLDPASHVPKTYRVKVRGHPSEATLEAWRRETLVVDGLALGPMGAEVERRGPSSSWLRITLMEGRNRQIRRRTAAAGHPVETLIRVAIGPLQLGRLAPGASRRLRPDEVRKLLSAGRLARRRAR